MGVPKPIASFVLPIGATVNMDGTSLHQAVAVIFMAQLHMVDLSLTQQLIIVFTASMASIGAAAVPSAGLIMMILVLQSYLDFTGCLQCATWFFKGAHNLIAYRVCHPTPVPFNQKCHMFQAAQYHVMRLDISQC